MLSTSPRVSLRFQRQKNVSGRFAQGSSTFSVCDGRQIGPHIVQRRRRVFHTLRELHPGRTSRRKDARPGHKLFLSADGAWPCECASPSRNGIRHNTFQSLGRLSPLLLLLNKRAVEPCLAHHLPLLEGPPLDLWHFHPTDLVTCPKPVAYTARKRASQCLSRRTLCSVTCSSCSVSCPHITLLPAPRRRVISQLSLLPAPHRIVRAAWIVRAIPSPRWCVHVTVQLEVRNSHNRNLRALPWSGLLNMTRPLQRSSTVPLETRNCTARRPSRHKRRGVPLREGTEGVRPSSNNSIDGSVIDGRDGAT